MSLFSDAFSEYSPAFAEWLGEDVVNLQTGETIKADFHEEDPSFVRLGSMLVPSTVSVSVGDHWSIDGEKWRVYFWEYSEGGQVSMLLHREFSELFDIQSITFGKSRSGASTPISTSVESDVRGVLVATEADDEQEEGRRQVRARYRLYFETFRQLGEKNRIVDSAGVVYRVQGFSEPEDPREFPYVTIEKLLN